MRSFWQIPELRFYLALAFLVWSLLPHYHLIIHAHGGSADGHTHATLSSEEMEFADQALQALPSAMPQEFGGDASAAPIAASASEGTFWASGAGLLSHAHFQQALNSVPALLLHHASPESPPAATTHALLYRAPASAVPAYRTARGPPASFLA